MANAFYPKFKEQVLGAGTNTNLLTADIRAILVDLADYTYAATHEFLSDVLAAARVSVSPTLTTVTVTDGILDCDDWIWPSVTGDVSEAVILYSHTGVEGTSPLILFLDTGLTNFPVTPDGNNINFAVNASGLAQI